MFRMKLLLIGICLCSISQGFSQDVWKIAKEKNGITIYTKSIEDSSLKSFKATVYFNCTIERIVHEILNLNDFMKWGYKIKEVDLLEREGDTIQIYYASSKAPFPFKNRDGIYKNTFKWNSEIETLNITIDALHDYLPEKENNIRVKGRGFWQIDVVSINKQFVTFEMHLDPGGSIPAWLTNMFVTDSPYSTLQKLKEIVEKKDARQFHFDFLK